MNWNSSIGWTGFYSTRCMALLCIVHASVRRFLLRSGDGWSWLLKDSILGIRSFLRLFHVLLVQVQVLLAELAMVEEEIVWLEGKVEELKLCLYQEKKENREWETQHKQWRRQQQRQLMCKPENGSELKILRQFHRSQNSEEFRKCTKVIERKAYLGRTSETQSMSSTRSNGK